MKQPSPEKSRKMWHKVTMSVAKDNADVVRRAIQSCHCCGIQEEDEEGNREHLDAYFAGAIDVSELQRHVEIVAELISAAGGRTLRLGSIEPVPEEDWAEEWRRTWKPVRISRTLVVCPSWQEFSKKPGQTVVYIYPRMAFGTGSHPTTRICLKLLEKYMPADSRVIDIGAGSGILAIAAAKLGARNVVAYEMNEAAVENARENCAFNRVRSRVRIIHDRFGRQARGKFDLGMCNMLGHIMQPLVDDITRVLTGKSLIASGLTMQSADEVKGNLVNRGWRIRKTLRDGEWMGLFAVHERM